MQRRYSPILPMGGIDRMDVQQILQIRSYDVSNDTDAKGEENVQVEFAHTGGWPGK